MSLAGAASKRADERLQKVFLYGIQVEDGPAVLVRQRPLRPESLPILVPGGAGRDSLQRRTGRVDELHAYFSQRIELDLNSAQPFPRLDLNLGPADSPVATDVGGQVSRQVVFAGRNVGKAEVPLGVGLDHVVPIEVKADENALQSEGVFRGQQLAGDAHLPTDHEVWSGHGSSVLGPDHVSGNVGKVQTGIGPGVDGRFEQFGIRVSRVLPAEKLLQQAIARHSRQLISSLPIRPGRGQPVGPEIADTDFAVWHSFVVSVEYAANNRSAPPNRDGSEIILLEQIPDEPHSVVPLDDPQPRICRDDRTPVGADPHLKTAVGPGLGQAQAIKVGPVSVPAVLNADHGSVDRLALLINHLAAQELARFQGKIHPGKLGVLARDVAGNV